MVSSTRPAGSVTSPYAAKRCRRSAAGPAGSTGSPRGMPAGSGVTGRPSSSAVNGISSRAAASSGVNQPTSSVPPAGSGRSRPPRASTSKISRSVCIATVSVRNGVTSATAARIAPGATVRPVSSANSRTTVSAGCSACSTPPPGNCHTPGYGHRAEPRASNTRPSESRSTP